jgi:hypothetical protein
MSVEGQASLRFLLEDCQSLVQSPKDAPALASKGASARFAEHRFIAVICAE